MVTSIVRYLGDLRTEAVHERSGTRIITDAPVDNQGKGEAFSPTDLLATSLSACMMTIMGIAARTHNIPMEKVESEVVKVMESSPRRVGRIEIKMRFPQGKLIDEKSRQILMKAGLTCPVYLSLHPDMEKAIDWIWE